MIRARAVLIAAAWWVAALALIAWWSPTILLAIVGPLWRAAWWWTRLAIARALSRAGWPEVALRLLDHLADEVEPERCRGTTAPRR